MPHKHRFRLSSLSSTTLTFQCVVGGRDCRTRCPEQRERPTTAAEKKVLKPDLNIFPKKGVRHIHTIWWEFAKRFMLPDPGGLAFKWSGHELSRKVVKWAAKYPKDVRIISCDDAFHASSQLVLIEHRKRDRYMGTTVCYIPQCTGEQPICFFLYPSHRSGLITALREIAKASAPAERRQKIAHAKDRKYLQSLRLNT